MVVAIVSGEMLNQIALGLNASLENSPIGSILILVANMIIMFALAFMIFLLSAK